MADLNRGSNLYINLAWLSVCLYPINVKTAEPIGSKFFVGHHVTTGKVYEWSKFQIFVSIKIFCENPRIIFVLFYDVHKKNMFTINLEDGREAPYKASSLNSISEVRTYVWSYWVSIILNSWFRDVISKLDLFNKFVTLKGMVTGHHSF